MPERAGTRFDDYVELLSALQSESAKVVIVGGQAVNFWAELYLRREPMLERFLPFTSRDLDLHHPDSFARKALRRQAAHVDRETDPFGKAFDVVDTSFAIRNRHGHLLLIEALKFVGGLGRRDVERSIVQVEYAGVNLRVLDPVALLKCKAHNLIHLNQEERQDEKHFRILLICLRAFVSDLLDRVDQQHKPRPVLSFLEKTLKMLLTSEVLCAAAKLQLNPQSALPLRKLAAHNDVHIANFMVKRLLKKKLRDARSRI